jgi:EAL domain-containing protein (putative c-di-GMP-specific phosphodiesterase class I)
LPTSPPGIETEAQKEMTKSLEVRIGQGYLLVAARLRCRGWRVGRLVRIGHGGPCDHAARSAEAT